MIAENPDFARAIELGMDPELLLNYPQEVL
jgi:hypothetical protein